GVNDVLQERFAVEMRCNTALRLAALHMQERLACSGQSPKTNLKMITKTWGIDNFVSSTLLRNMREKDLRKAISYHMKKGQSQHDPKQKEFSVNQARINYLEELSELKSFGGKTFSATMMLQDRESVVTLLVGARYGVSQVVNHKLSILTTLTEFTSITRIELLPESDRVSLVKIYLQDIKPITLLLESVAAKDMSCLIAGYCRVFVDPNLNIFTWTDDSKKHRVSAEEGYVSRCASDSDNSSDLEEMVTMLPHNDKPYHHVRCSSDLEGRKKKDGQGRRLKDGKEKTDKLLGCKKEKEEKDADTEKNKSLADKNREDKKEDTEQKDDGMETVIERAAGGGQIQIETTDSDLDEQQKRIGTQKDGQESKEGGGEEVQATEEQPSVSEASDSCHTDSRVLTSPSSDSLDALEEDDLISCSSSSIHPCPDTPLQSHAHIQSSYQIHLYSHRHAQPHFLTPPPAHSHPLIYLTSHDELEDRGEGGESMRTNNGADSQLLASVSTSTSLDHTQKCSGNPCSEDSSLCFVELSRLVEYLPSPPEASEDEEGEEEELRRMKLLKEMEETVRRADEGGSAGGEGNFLEHPLSPSTSSPSSHMGFVFNFEEGDASCYYKLCSNITPDSAHSLSHPLHNKGRKEEEEQGMEGDEAKVVDLQVIPFLQPPPGFGDSSSDEEFFDASDRFTSPEDPISGDMPRDFCTDMKLDLLSTLSLSDIRITMAGVAGKTEDDKGRPEEAGGGRETLFQLRKRSRKRRSFMETDYTSTVSYPEPNLKSKPDPVSSRLQKNLLSQGNDGQMLSSDPEPSEQTQNPCLTVSSLTHSEGEPAQLESKPILSKGSFGSQGHTRDPPASSRNKKQEMEMEPDSMEFKSVTDLVRVIPPTITVVRCRVDPDGKECTDQRGDGKEEGEEQEEMIDGKGEEEQQKLTGVSGSGPLNSHMFLPEIIEKEVKGEEMGEERAEGVRGDYLSSLKILLISAERQTESNLLPICLIDVSKNGSNGLPRSNLSAQEQNEYKEAHERDSTCSPNIMGRLSASTLRGKIQRLPLYLSHNQETFGQAEVGNVAQSPAEDISRDNTHDTRDVTKTVDVEMGTTAESVDSDDSDTTITGSEIDGEFAMETISTEISHSVMLEVKEVEERAVTVYECPSLPVQTEPKREHQNQPLYAGPYKNTPGPITEPPGPIMGKLDTQREPTGPNMDIPCPVKDATESEMKVTSEHANIPGYEICNQSPLIPPPIVVTAQNLNGPGLAFHNEPQKVRRTSGDRPLMALCSNTAQNSDSIETLSSGCRLFTICEDLSQTKPPAHLGSSPSLKSDFGCSSVFASGCESVVEGVQIPLDACGCPMVYTSCFSGGDSFDDELTVYEFSCRTQSSGQQCYPEPPVGFRALRGDVDQLLAIIEGGGADRPVTVHGGRHPRDTCPAHFTENKRALHIEARRLMAGCQKVVGIGQSPEEMLHSLAECVRTLVDLASICLCFSGCDRCDRRNAEAVAGLADVARSFRDFCLAAERASSKRSCQDLSTKLLAKQCTALTASVFCLTQPFRTLTAL
ncbi:hypothetical protein LDENG_00216790, partial [Lucifuga dentata]